ncbi:MAG: NADH:flavin oxidoreductase [Chloroflexi bacterium]|nr:NADH:flavin oxidoreductase [Chloroflexota bacterium]
MSNLFESATVGRLTLRSRIMRSATAERVAHPESGEPHTKQGEMYTALAEGGVGLIVTGHAYVEHGGRAHPEMASIASDDVISVWRDLIRPAQAAGARLMMQINHGGASCDPAVTPQPLSPSGVVTNESVTPCAMSEEDVRRIAQSFGQAARRVREAGFDGVQIHGAHGYLVSQFLTPMTNLREDAWGGDAERRFAFLHTIVEQVRCQVGDDYPVWIKLGVAGRDDTHLTIAEGARIAAACVDCGVDCIEISNALGTPKDIDERQEAPYHPWAKAVRQAVGDDFPLALVNGFRTRASMQAVLDNDLVQMVSLCRPLIAEPNLPNTLRENSDYEHACTRCDQCWPKESGMGSACYNAGVLRRLGSL